MNWWEDKLLAFDLETTGVDVFNDRIVTASLVEIRPNQRPRTYSWLLNPGVDIPEAAAVIHGITTEHARASGTDPEVGLFEISARLGHALSSGIPVVAFNAAYDLSILEAENHRHGLPTLAHRLAPRPIAPIMDPYVIDKATSRRRGKRTLDAQCEFHGVTLAAAHTADADALAAARLLLVLLKKNKDLQGHPAMVLHNKQVGWRADQQSSLRLYLQKMGRPADDVFEEWPVRALPEAAGIAS